MRHVAAVSLIIAASTTAAQTELVIHVDADRQVVQPGESVNYTIWAELLEPQYEVLAVVSDITFSLWFDGTDIEISYNSFESTFDSDFFGPADSGDNHGSYISNAVGSNVIPPLNNSDGPDSSNPIQIYTLTATVPVHARFLSYTPDLIIHGHTNGAYVGSPFPTILWYHRNGAVPNTPHRVESDTIYVPTPSASLVLVCTGLFAARRRR